MRKWNIQSSFRYFIKLFAIQSSLILKESANTFNKFMKVSKKSYLDVFLLKNWTCKIHWKTAIRQWVPGQFKMFDLIWFDLFKRLILNVFR